MAYERHHDWSPLGLSSDPVPGDPYTVRSAGLDYIDIADAIADAARKLRRLEEIGDTSEATDELRGKAKSVADNISKAHDRYRATGVALRDYAPKLEDAQELSLDALHDAQKAQGDADSAATSKTHYLKLADEADDPDDALKYTNLANDPAAANAASSKLTAAKSKLHEATGARDRAADAAADDIKDITDHDGLKDSWWDNWGADVLKIITEVAGWVAAIAGVLALLVGWIPVIGQLLGSALLIIAAVAAVINAVGSLILAATGEMSWTQAIISVVGAVLSCVGLGGATRVFLSEAGRASEAFAAAKTVNKLASEQTLGKVWDSAAGKLVDEQVGTITKWQALKISPQEWEESLTAWGTELPTRTELKNVKVYRTYGGGSRPDGGSWTTIDPRTMDFPQSTMGLPEGNTVENMVKGTLTRPNKPDIIRHALPLDGNPGGAIELKYDSLGTFTEKGIRHAKILDFTLP